MSAVEQLYSADIVEIVLDLPPPPSVNRTRKVHWKGHKKYVAWKKEASWHLTENGQLRIAKPGILGKYELTVTINESKCGSDPDNILKGCIDLLRSLNLIVDDSPAYARRIIVQYGHVPDGARVTLRSMQG